jgi:hypothetical protein
MTTRYKPAQISVDSHEWLRTEAFLRRTSITAELDAAVALLREQREAKDGASAGQHGAVAQGTAAAVSA